jgi:hypothetical protein
VIKEKQYVRMRKLREKEEAHLYFTGSKGEITAEIMEGEDKRDGTKELRRRIMCCCFA